MGTRSSVRVLVARCVLALWSPCALALAMQDSGVPSDVLREWTVREWALAPADHAPQLLAAASATDWRERYMALDALGRSRAGASWVGVGGGGGGGANFPLAMLLADGHPNVRAAALNLIEHLDVAPADARERLLAIAREFGEDPATEAAPGAREALATALGGAACLRSGDVREADTRAVHDALLALARDARSRAGRLARTELFTLGPEADEALAGLLATDFEALGETAWIEALPHLIRVVHGPGVARALRESALQGGAGARALAEAFALHMELRRAPDAPRADRDALAAGWLADPDDSRRRAALIEVARLGDDELGEALMRSALAREAAGLGAEDEGTTFLVECAAMALDPGDAAERALALGPDLASLVWNELAPRPHAWSADDVRPWLAPDVPPDLRAQVVDVAAGPYLERHDPEAELVLLEALRDPDPDLRANAFRWLARGDDPAALHGALFEAWKTFELDVRLELLRDLPRDAAPVPFRAALLELGEERATRPASVVELLATLSADDEVRATLARWFDDEIRALEVRPDQRAFRALELGARDLARALRAALGEEAAALLDDALRRTLRLAPRSEADSGSEPAPDEASTRRSILPKALAGELARLARGRERLAGYLAPETPRRVRIEAALGLITEPVVHRRAAAALREDYASCDTVLRQRILRALARAVDPVNVEFLEGVARDERAPLEQRVTAVDVLEARGASQALNDVLHSAEEVEVRLAIIAKGYSSALLLSRARAGPWIENESRVREVLALEAASPVRAREFLGDESLGDLLRRPLARAARDLAGRFDGRGGASAAARWAPELALARALASHLPGTFSASLERCGAWWRLEPELLGLLAEVARDEPWIGTDGESNRAVAARLCEAALVALHGEAPGESTDGNYLRLYLLAMNLAQEREDWPALAYWADRAQHFARLQPGTFRALEARMGTVDRRAGVDPWARLASVREQARARCAEGDERAQRTERARTLVGFSDAARAAQGSSSAGSADGIALPDRRGSSQEGPRVGSSRRA